MNNRQFVILWIGILVMVGMGIYPPWIEMGELQMGLRSEIPAGYHPLIRDKPEDLCKDIVESWFVVTPVGFTPITIKPTGTKIDMVRLLIQWFCVVLLSGGLILSFRTLQKRK